MTNTKQNITFHIITSRGCEGSTLNQHSLQSLWQPSGEGRRSELSVTPVLLNHRGLIKLNFLRQEEVVSRSRPNLP